MRAQARGSRWILSPLADGALIVGAPLVCVALVLPLATVMAPVSLWVAVMAFGAVGHHLPGFLRTYGNRELFQRFRLRFLLAPPLVFAATLICAMRGLHGVALIALVWAIWHGMMQHYGFMRIYEAKAGSVPPGSARLDFAMTVSWFSTCVLFGPHQSASILDGFQAVGFPIPPPDVVAGLRAATVVATVSTTALYAAHVVRALRRGEPVSWQKLALLVTTTGLVWFARVATSDPYVSVVLFEVLHDVQYLAIVWAFNRRLVTTGRDSSRISRAMFGARVSSFVLYVVACLAYGGIAFAAFTAVPEGTAKTVLVSLLVTSGLLHYYYDGFIWKLRSSDTREGLELAGAGAGASRRTAPHGDRPALAHLGAFALVVAVLVGVQAKKGAADPVGEARRIAELVPDSPTSQYNLGAALLEVGRAAEAIPHLRRAIARQPTLASAHMNLGSALVATGDVPGALDALETAVRIDPGLAGAHLLLGNARAQRGDPAGAVEAYTAALRLGPETAGLHANLGYALIALERLGDAEHHLAAALALDPASFAAHLNLGLLLARQQRFAAALPHLEIAVARKPDVAAARNSLGAVLLQLGRRDEAAVQFRTALQIDPDFAPARHNLARLSEPSSPR